MGSLFSLREFRLKYPYESSKKQISVAISDAKFDFGEGKVDIKHKIKDLNHTESQINIILLIQLKDS
jgi:hypothetical protein